MSDKKTLKDFTDKKGSGAIKESALLADAVLMMRKFDCQSLLVKDEDMKTVGLITEHDIATAFSKLGDYAGKAYVRDFMMIDVVCIEEYESVDNAIKLMAAENIRNVPVIAEDGHVIKFLSVMDLLLARMTGTSG